MIDLHAHLLPGLDDGPLHMEDALELCRRAWAAGVRKAVATPHQFNGFDRVTPAQIREGTAALSRRLTQEGIDLEVLPGAEVYIHVELPRNLALGRIMTLCDQGRYLLLELPGDRLPLGFADFLKKLRNRGVEIILAHPERNVEIRDDPECLEPLVEEGLLLQLTAGSITGACGRHAQAGARALFERGLVHLVASDAHGPWGRPFHLAEARSVLSAALGEAAVEAIFHVRPEAILSAGAREGAPSGSTTARDPGVDP